jgi:hypothetical protein
MRRRGLISSILAASAAVLALAMAAPPARADAAAEAHYRALLAAAKAGRSVDWRALRLAYADSAEFDLTGSSMEATRKAMYAALNGGDAARALAQAQAILDHEFVNIEAHLAAAKAYRELGQPSAAAQERAIAAGLLQSIQTGDGTSPATAFTPIAIREEYVLVGARGRRVTRQSLISRDGHSYDVLDTTSDAGDTKSFYFLIDRVLAAEAAAFMK